MNFLFVAYCFGSPGGDSLIGVYKRALRIGLVLVERGHEVAILCPGRHAYRDGLVENAETVMKFIDFPLDVLFENDVNRRRSQYGAVLKDLNIDVVVAGESPIAGTLLDATITAIEARVPLVIVDNTYGALHVSHFIHDHGAMCDAMLLTGPQSFHLPTPPAFVRQVPPFVRREPGAAAEMLAALQVSDRRLVTVLGYEIKAELLAISLMQKLAPPLPEFLFLTRDREACEGRLSELPDSVRSHAHIVAPPSEPTLFDLLANSRLCIGKCGFMQVTESLSLGTPFLAIYYRGCFEPEMLPEVAADFVHVTTTTDAEPVVVQAAERFLKLERSSLHVVHDGRFDATEQAADLLQSIRREPRVVCPTEREPFGYSSGLIRSLLSACYSDDDDVQLEDFRISRIRRFSDRVLDSIVCKVRLRREASSLALWGHFHADEAAYARALEIAEAEGTERKVIWRSSLFRFFAEVDLGERLLPPVHP